MADMSQVEADLFAALGMPPLQPEEPAPTQENTTQPRSHDGQPPQQPSSEVPPAPSAPAVISPPPTSATAPPTDRPASTPTSNSVQTSAPTLSAAATLSPTAAAPASNTPRIPEPDTKTSSPPAPQHAQTNGQPLPSSQTPNTALQQTPVAAPVSVSPREPVGPRSPKRPRNSDGLDESSIKRQKLNQASPKPDAAIAGPNLDLAAMLNDALASFDQNANPGDGDIMMQDANLAPPAAPASMTPEPEKAVMKIMKASSNPFYVMRSMSLPMLGNIAVQILLRLSQQPREETEALLADGNSEFRRAYDMLRDIFRATRRSFSDSPLLSADELDITDSEDRETIRMSNLAATAASVFGAHDVSVQDVHDAFFSIFIPEDAEYRSSLTEMLISLKTRLLLAALNTPDQAQPLSQLLDTLFPVNFDEALNQRSGDLLLNADEDGLVARMRERREQLVKSAADDSIKKFLEDQSSPARFAESLSLFLQSHLAIVVDYAEKYGVNIPLNEEDNASMREPSNPQEEHDSLAALLQSATSHLAPAEEGPTQAKDVLPNGTIPDLGSIDDDGLELKKLIEESLSNHPELKDQWNEQQSSAEAPGFDSKNLASFISEKLKTEHDIPTHGLANMSTAAHPSGTAVHPQFMAALNNNQPQSYQSYNQGSTPAPPVGANGDHLPPNQSLPTAALYERARQAAAAKSANTTRREGLHSTRRPWSPEEEKALMAGLDMVKGPHWSQILSLFGPHGSISDILKERTQVQLKDKARNLKLFFLKTNSEMPYYLQSVTGELKTRAPGQAARKEAEEKARMNLEEEQARIQGIMTLAGGLQNNHHPNAALGTSPKRASPATSVYGGAGAGAGTGAAYMATANGSAMPGMPPRVKTELSDQHSLSKVTTFPPIQPAPAPGSAMQQARTPLPPLQPQPGPPQQQRPQNQQQYQQPQQLQQPQKPPMALPQQPQQHQQQHQQQQRQPFPHQPQVQHHSQQPPQPSSQPQPQAQMYKQPQPQHHQQAQSQLPQPAARTTAASQAVSPPAPSAPRPSAPQQGPPQPQQQSQVSPPTQQTQPLSTPPIPPNHHSTPDHAQDAKLYETLQAALAAPAANENRLPAAAAVSDGSTAVN